MLSRMVARGQGPRIRVDADAELLGVVPQFNVIAEMRGSELPGEYVILSAHLDSWHAATGATDNGTGTITMLEAMRILKQTYPEPKRTILVGHWGPEEIGHTGSRAFTEDHADLLDDIQVLFNQDNGTWRFELIEGQGMALAGEHVTRWMSQVPEEIASHITLDFPGPQENRGSDAGLRGFGRPRARAARPRGAAHRPAHRRAARVGPVPAGAEEFLGGGASPAALRPLWRRTPRSRPSLGVTGAHDRADLGHGRARRQERLHQQFEAHRRVCRFHLRNARLAGADALRQFRLAPPQRCAAALQAHRERGLGADQRRL
jgi:hypothetical protein